jgi:hypothetical protein
MMSFNEGSLPPEQAKEVKLQMLHKFYQTTTLEELVLAQDYQIEKLQAKLANPRGLLGDINTQRGIPNRVREG